MLGSALPNDQTETIGFIGLISSIQGKTIHGLGDDSPTSSGTLFQRDFGQRLYRGLERANGNRA